MTSCDGFGVRTLARAFIAPGDPWQNRYVVMRPPCLILSGNVGDIWGQNSQPTGVYKTKAAVGRYRN